MAVITGHAVSTPVHVVCLMTQTTLSGSLLKLLQRHLRRMAGVTRQALVRSLQRKLCLLVVIKTPNAPPHRMVASTAFSAHCAFMHIVLLMTAHALRPLSDKGKVRMAAFTGDRCVTAQEREGGQIVIETDLMLPAAFVMAAFTGRTQRAFVHIILGMTLGALR